MGGSTDITRRGALGTSLAVAIGGQGVAVAAEQKTTAGAAEKVQGIGGFFFRAKDPGALAAWYEAHLGVTRQVWHAGGGATAFQPFPHDTDHFGDAQHHWMLNFRVQDLDRMAAQLRAAGIAVEVDPKTYPYGRFAHLADPEGNRVELWQPGAQG